MPSFLIDHSNENFLYRIILECQILLMFEYWSLIESVAEEIFWDFYWEDEGSG